MGVTADELKRRLVHASGVVLPAGYLLAVITWEQLRILFVVGAAIAIGLEVLRLFVGLDWAIYEELTREYERDNLAGYAIYFVSSAAVVLLFSPRIALPAVLMLMIADPVSGLLSSDELRDVKRPFVITMTFLVSALIAIWFVPPLPAVLGAVTATAADGAKPVVAGYVIDDNLTIPIGAAVAIWIGIRYLPAVPV
ncbi:MAG: dolichol kinase [Halobacteriales archaeon]|nr:dolichol kinase [Halobacteriales archaeon]